MFRFQNKSNTAPTAFGPVEYLIVGLGNPGTQYENTRHNTGFRAIDTVAAHAGCTIQKIQFKGLTGKASINGHTCLLLKPSTYMNNSGESVVAAMNFYKIPIERVIVIYDDISLEPSHLRIRRKGTDGGHNGIKSIIYLTGKDGFPRVKIGVGKKPHPQYDLADWVLSNFKKEELPLMEEAFVHCCEAIDCLVAGQTEKAMNLFNS